MLARDRKSSFIKISLFPKLTLHMLLPILLRLPWVNHFMMMFTCKRKKGCFCQNLLVVALQTSTEFLEDIFVDVMIMFSCKRKECFYHKIFVFYLHFFFDIRRRIYVNAMMMFSFKRNNGYFCQKKKFSRLALYGLLTVI